MPLFSGKLLEKASQLGSIMEVVDLLAAIGKISDPLTSVDGLRKLVDTLVEVGKVVGKVTGSDELLAFLKEIEPIAEDPRTLEFVVMVIVLLKNRQVA